MGEEISGEGRRWLTRKCSWICTCDNEWL